MATAPDYTPRLVSLRFEDAAGLGMTIGPGDGQFSGGDENAENAEAVAVYDRGAFDGMNKTQDIAQECSVTVRDIAQSLTTTLANRVRDFMLKSGAFSAAQSVDASVWAFKAILTYTAPAGTFTKTYPYCRGGMAEAHGFPSNTLTLTWTNYQAPVRA